MRTLLLLLLVLTVGGCTTMGKNTLVSPAESLYFDGEKYFEQGTYHTAIELYEQFLEANPRSDLATPAKLNLGMAYYYNKNHKQAYDVFKDLIVKDENIKKYVDEILEICKTEAKDEIEAEEKTKIAEAEKAAEAGEIEIAVLDAYLDNFGAVILKGTVDQESTVTIDNKKITPDDNNIFNATAASWKRGDSILITAKGTDGSIGELNYFPDGEEPLKPERLRTINITSNSIEIEWDENDEEDIKGYRLFYRSLGGSLHEVQELIIDTQHEIVGLAGRGSNTIEFYLRAVDKMDNESQDSDILQADLL